MYFNYFFHITLSSFRATQDIREQGLVRPSFNSHFPSLSFYNFSTWPRSWNSRLDQTYVIYNYMSQHHIFKSRFTRTRPAFRPESPSVNSHFPSCHFTIFPPELEVECQDWMKSIFSHLEFVSHHHIFKEQDLLSGQSRHLSIPISPPVIFQFVHLN